MASREPNVVHGRHKIIMYYTYVLKSQKDKKLYIGYSTDLENRLERHQKGGVESTKHRRPLDLIFYETFRDKRDAQRREKYFKTEKGKSSLNQVVRFSKV